MVIPVRPGITQENVQGVIDFFPKAAVWIWENLTIAGNILVQPLGEQPVPGNDVLPKFGTEAVTREDPVITALYWLPIVVGAGVAVYVIRSR